MLATHPAPANFVVARPSLRPVIERLIADSLAESPLPPSAEAIRVRAEAETGRRIGLPIVRHVARGIRITLTA